MMLMLKLQTLAMLLVLLLGVVAMLEPALKRHRGQDYEAKQALTTKVAALKAGGDVLFKEAWLLGRTGQTRKMNARDRADHTAAYSQKCTEAFAAGHSLARVGQRYGVGTDDRKLCDIAMVTMLAGFPQRFGLTFEVGASACTVWDCGRARALSPSLSLSLSKAPRHLSCFPLHSHILYRLTHSLGPARSAFPPPPFPCAMLPTSGSSTADD